MEGKSNLTIEFVRDVITPIIMNRFCSKFGNCEIDEITTDSTWRTSWTSEAKKNKIRIVLYVPARGRTFTYMCTSHVLIDLRDEEFDLPSGVQTRPVCHVWVRSSNSRWDKLLTVGPQIGNGQFLSIGDMAENKYVSGLVENEIFGRDNLLDITRTACEKINHAIERDLEVYARETAATLRKFLPDTKLGNEEKQMEIRLGNVAIRWVKYTDFTHRYAVFEIGRVAKGELEALEKAYSHLSHQIDGDPTNGTLQQKNVMGSLYTAVRLCLLVPGNICARNDLIEKENDTSEVTITYTSTNFRPTLIRIEHSSLAWSSPSWFTRFPVDWDAKEKEEDTTPKLLPESDAKRKTGDPIITLHFLHHVVAPCIVAELKKHFEEARIIKRECCSVLEGKLMRLPDGPNISSRYSVLIGVIDGRPDRTMRYVKLEYWRNCDLVDHSIIGDKNFIRVFATNNQLELVEIMHIGRRKSSDPSQCKAVATATGENFTFWNVPAKMMIENMISLINHSIDHKFTMLMFPGENKTLTELGAVPFGLVACTMKNLFEDYAHPSKHYQRQYYKRDQEIIYYDDEQSFEKDPSCPVYFGATKLPSGQINVWFIDRSHVGILVQEFHIHKNTDDDGPWAKVLNFWVPDIPEQFCNCKMREKINGLINEICAKINLVCSGYTVCDTPEQKFWSYFKGFNVKAHVDDLNTDVIKSACTMLAIKQDKQTNEKTEDSDKLVITEGKPSTAGRLRPNPEFLWRGMQVLTDKIPLMVDTERRGLKDLSVKKVSFEEWVEMTAKPVYKFPKMKRRIVEKTIDVNNIDLNTPGLVSSDDWGKLIHAFHDAKFTVDTEEIKQILRYLKEENDMREKKIEVFEPEVLKRWNNDSEYLLFNYVRIAMNKLIMTWHRTRSVQWKGVDHIESVNCASWETKTDPVYRVELVHHSDDDIMSFYEVDPKTGKKYQIPRNAESFDKRFGRGFYDAVDGIYKAVARLKTELQAGEVLKSEDPTATEKKEEKEMSEPKYPHYSTDKNGKKLITIPWDTYKQLSSAQYGISASVRIIKDRCTEIKDAYWNPKTGTATIIWADGTKTTAKAMKGTDADPEIGFAICVAKKFFGAQNQYRKWLKSIVDASTASAKKKADKKLTKLTKQARARLAAEGITDPSQDQVDAYIDKIDAENKAASKAAKAEPATVPAKKATTPKKKGK